MRRAAACAVLAVLVLPLSPSALPTGDVSPLAPPEPGLADTAEGPTPAFLDLTLNGVGGGEALLVRIDGGDVWARVEDLEVAGLQGLRGVRREEDGAAWVSLRSLAPALSFEVDERALVLHIAASADLLGRRTLDLSALRRPAGLEVRSDPALFVNYSLQGNDEQRGAAFLEAGAFAEGWRVTSGASRGLDGAFSRGTTTAARELRDSLVELAAGDVFARGDLLGGSLMLGGLSVKRDFGLDPYLVRQPMPQGSVVAMTPSTLELYVNGSLVKRELVAPGVLDLTHIPAVTGRGDARAVLRDAFGRTQEFTSEYYAGAGLLAPGLSDFGYHVGFTRESFAGAGLGYRRASIIARHRLGLSTWATGGLRLDAGLDRVSGGPMLTAALPLGEVELAAAASGHDRAAGAAGSLAWSWLSGRLSSQLVLRGSSPRYANASLGARDDRALAESLARIGVPLRKALGLHLEGTLARWRDRGSEQRISARASLGFAHHASVQLGGGWSHTVLSRGFDALLLVSWSTGARSSAQLSAQAEGGEALARASAQRQLPRGDGTGYRVEALSGGAADPQGAAELQWQSRAARVEARVDRRGPLQAASATVSGAVVWMAGDVFLTRPVQDGFALVEVADVEGVRVTLENQDVGRTGTDGRLLVTGLLPYHANRLGFRTSDVPLDYDFGALERIVAPPRRGGAHVRFDVEKTRSLTGSVAVDLGAIVVTPSYGEIRVSSAGAEAASPISREGRFFIERLQPGIHDAVVEYASGICRLAIEVPPRTGLVDVGVLRCDQRRASATAAPPSVPAASPSPVPSPSAASASPAGAPSASTVITSTSGPFASAGAR